MLEPMSKLTSEKLAELTDEVREFHPILHRLFNAMPGFYRVDYNQGPDELGADFILHRKDEVLEVVDHIGVVVKIGKLTTNFSEIERQIDECFLVRRKSKDGIDEIQINEVWVVISENVTRNAKEKIFAKYPGKRVRIFPGEDVARLLDKYVPNEFITTPPQLQQYSSEAQLRLSIEDQNSLVVPGGADFYIDPIIERLEYDHTGRLCSTKSVGGIDKLLSKMSESPFSFIEGGMGIGKSKLVRELVRKYLSSSQFEKGNVFPYFLHCNTFLAEYGFDIEKLASEVRAKYRLNGACKLQVILDGFDEVDLSSDERHSKLDAILGYLARGAGIGLCITSRPADEWNMFGARAQSLDIYRLKPLRGSKAIEFLAKIGGQLDVNSRIIRDIADSKLFLSLEGSPIAFMLLGRLIAENKHDVPSNLTELFQKYLELILGRWEIAKGLRSQVEYEVAMEALTWLGGVLMDRKLREVGRSELISHIEEYSKERGIDVDVSELVPKLYARSGVLFCNVDQDCVGFRHRSFCEFFYARLLHGRNGKGIEITSACFHPYWANAYFFLAGHLRDCPDFIKSLANTEVRDDSERFARALNFGNFMLAGYLTPQKVVSDALRIVIKDLASLYLQIARREIVSPLSDLPTIQLLCIISMIVTRQYGYPHFKFSLGEAIFELEASGQSEENALALFLLDAAYKEAGGELRFDDLLEKYGEALPVPLKLAIKHEAGRMKAISDRVKRMERNLRRQFSAHTGGAAEYIKRIYDVPISKLPRPEI